MHTPELSAPALLSWALTSFSVSFGWFVGAWVVSGLRSLAARRPSR